ncbi:MAG: endonuclease [Candidatus Thermoplasmatota archaeon]|nr:endonuclease [Candidatus Thermoplasmatota archaeon]
MTASIFLAIGVILASVVIILIIGFVLERRILKLKLLMEQERLSAQKTAEETAKMLFNQWAEASINTIRTQITETLKKDYEVQLESWKKQEEKKIREDAIQKSINTLLGKIGEEFSPVLLANKYGINLKDFRHLGTPVDFVAFKGLSDGSTEVEVLFLEIKSGKSSGLVGRERMVRDAVKNKRVSYEVVNLGEMIGGFKSELNGNNLA